MLTGLLMLLAAPMYAGSSKSEEIQFRSWLVRYFKSDHDDDDLQNLVYGYALVDLNRDGRNEAIVWAKDVHRCGTGGCLLEIFGHRRSGWRLVSTTTITRPPIKLLSTRSAGWRDLASWQAGGGIERPYEARLRFNGKEYEIVSPKDWAGVKPRPPLLNGRTLIADAVIPLFPSKCQPVKEAPSVFGPMPIPTGKPGNC